MGTNTFFQVSNMGAKTFFEVEKVGARTFLACEIRGLVVFFNRQFPQNQAWVPGKFWMVPNWVLFWMKSDEDLIIILIPPKSMT